MGVRAEDAVRADELAPVCGDPPHRLLAGVVDDHRRGELALEEEVEHRLDGVAAALGDRPAGDDDVLRPERAEQVLPARQPVRDVGFDPAACLGVTRAGERRLGAALLSPPRQQRGEQRRAGAVGVLVERRPRPVDEVEQRLEQLFAGERLEMREMEWRARALRDLDHLPHGVEDTRALVADVRDERGAELGRHARHRDELLRVGEGARDVDEPERQHPRTGLEGKARLAAHRLDVAVAGLSDGPVRRRGDERRGSRGQRVEVLRERRPRPFRRAVALERAEVGPPRLPVSDRRGRQAVGTDHLGREALEDLRREQRVVERLERRVRVEVDEPGAEHQPFGVDDVSLDARPDRGDAPVRHADVRAKRRTVARVDLGASEDEHYRTASRPPSTYRICPLTKSEAGEARKTTAPPSSDGSPQRRAGTRCSSHATNSGLSWRSWFISVRK